MIFFYIVECQNIDLQCSASENVESEMEIISATPLLILVNYLPENTVCTGTELFPFHSGNKNNFVDQIVRSDGVGILYRDHQVLAVKRETSVNDFKSVQSLGL